MDVVNDFAWDDRYLVGHRGMDESHQEFLKLVGAMLRADDVGFAASLDAFALHVQAHFEDERQLMERHGFPARECHVDEHERVLASVREVQLLVAEGDVQIGRELATALGCWLPGHVDYMDSALSIWITKQLANGAPVVLRRSMRHA